MKQGKEKIVSDIFFVLYGSDYIEYMYEFIFCALFFIFWTLDLSFTGGTY